MIIHVWNSTGKPQQYNQRGGAFSAKNILQIHSFESMISLYFIKQNTMMLFNIIWDFATHWRYFLSN